MNLMSKFKDLFAPKYRASNSRRAIRMKASYLARYMVIHGGVESEIRTANTKDISATGVRLIVSERIAPGEMVRLQLLLPPIEKTIAAFGRITRVEDAPHGLSYMSVSFVEINEVDQVILDTFLRERFKSRESQDLFDHEETVTRKVERAAVEKKA
ncbi:MAG TPA: PilZ domain-containing protein [Verrucomicrobiae bacterium]|jgi:c-di-GMP-binding flagellar brake protein YcgR|nr:PilZ domain-containing protein [Verrucomicrobiae bacterium]